MQKAYVLTWRALVSVSSTSKRHIVFLMGRASSGGYTLAASVMMESKAETTIKAAVKNAESDTVQEIRLALLAELEPRRQIDCSQFAQSKVGFRVQGT